MRVTGFVFSMFSGSTGKKLVSYPLFSITSQVWEDAPKTDIMSPNVLRVVGLLTSRDGSDFSAVGSTEAPVWKPRALAID
jgi:hypothetical protein